MARCLRSEEAEPTGNAHIYLMNADGSEIRRLTQHTDDPFGGIYSYFRPLWAPDGTRIVFSIFTGNVSTPEGLTDTWQIRVVDVRDGSEHVVNDDQADAQFPAWSPDGSRIVFIRFSPAGTGRAVVVNADGSHKTILPTPVDGVPYWAPDGSAIVTRGQYGQDGWGTVVIIDLATTDAVVLTPQPVSKGSDALTVGEVSWQRLAR